MKGLKKKGLSINKAVQYNDIPVKVLKENANFFSEQVTLQFNEVIYSSKYVESFKLASITPAFKQGCRNLKDNYRLISILLLSPKYLKSSCANIFQIILIIYFQNFNVVFERDLLRSIVFF